MADTYYVLNEADRQAIRKLLAESRTAGIGASGRPRVDDRLPMAPEVYLVRSPDEGIPALAQEAGTGTGADANEDTPGSAQCRVFRTLTRAGTEVVRPVDGLTIRVFNLLPHAIPGLAWIVAARDKFGRWYALYSRSDVDVVVKIADGTLVNGKYDVLVQPRDNANEEWDNATAAWAIDLAGSASLTAGERYLGTYSGREVGGPFYVSIVDDNDAPLTDTDAWLPLKGDPATPLEYASPIVETVDIENGDQTLGLVEDSAPTDFASTLQVVFVDSGSSIIRGVVTIVGTDATGREIREYVDITNSGISTYTTFLRFQTVDSITVNKVQGAAASGDTLEIKITKYPTGAIRSVGGVVYVVLNPDGTDSSPPSGDWQEIEFNNRGEHLVSEVYQSGDYVQESRALYAIRSGCCCPDEASGTAWFNARAESEGLDPEFVSQGLSQEVVGLSTYLVWTCPPCTRTVTIRCWGSGGTVNATGVGSGGGSFAESTASVTPGEKLYILYFTELFAAVLRGDPANSGIVTPGLGIVCKAACTTGSTGANADDCIGDIVASGGDGGSRYHDIYFFDGGGGGSGGPQGDGEDGEDGTADGPGQGGDGYGSGGDGYDDGISGTAPSLMVKPQSPGGGRGGCTNREGGGSFIGGSGNGFVSISWGGISSVNGQTGAVTIVGSNGVSVSPRTPGESGVITIGQNKVHVGRGAPGSTIGVPGDGYIDLDTGDFYWAT